MPKDEKEPGDEVLGILPSGTGLTEELAEQWAEEIEKNPPDPSELVPRHVVRAPRVGFRIPMNVYKAAWKRADEEGRSLSSLAREALERYLES